MTVLIKHPRLPEAPPARTTEKAYEEIWKPKGWELVETPETETPTEVSEPATAGKTKKPEA